MRQSVVWSAVIVMIASTAHAAEVYTIIPSSAPHAVMHPSGTIHMLEQTTVELPKGASELAFDFQSAGVSRQSVRIAHMSAPDVQILERYRSATSPGTVRWTLHSPTRQRVTVLLRYEPAGIEVSVAYDALIAPGGSLSLTANVTARNGGSQDYQPLQITTATGACFATALPPGATVTQELETYSPVPCDTTYVYHTDEYGEGVWEVVSCVPSTSRALCGGRLRFVTDSAGLQQTVGKTTLPYTRRGERVVLRVRRSQELSVTGGLAQSQQKSVKTDVYKKLALFDRHETYEFDVYNRSDEAKSLQLHVHHTGDWSVTDHSHDTQRADAQTAVVSIPVPAASSVPVSFTIVTENLTP